MIRLKSFTRVCNSLEIVCGQLFWLFVLYTWMALMEWNNKQIQGTTDFFLKCYISSKLVLVALNYNVWVSFCPPLLNWKNVLLYKQVIWFLQNEFCLPLNTDSVNGRHENPYFRPFFRRFYAYSYCSSLGLLFKLTLPSQKTGTQSLTVPRMWCLHFRVIMYRQFYSFFFLFNELGDFIML